MGGWIGGRHHCEVGAGGHGAPMPGARMNADDFLKHVKDPEAWYRKSRGLRRAAQALQPRLDSLCHHINALSKAAGTLGTTEEGVPLQSAFTDILNAQRLLYGLSLETAFKGKILETIPEEVKVEVDTDSAGAVLHAELTAIGVPLKRAHDLVALAEKLGLLPGPGVSVHEMYEHEMSLLRAELKQLSEGVLWDARYPVPRWAKAAVPGAPVKWGIGVFVSLVEEVLDDIIPLDPHGDGPIDGVDLPGGKRIPAACGILGLAPDLSRVTMGFQADVERYDEEPNPFDEDPEALTPAERTALADIMIARWQAYRSVCIEQGKPMPPPEIPPSSDD
jgi:hypothetical protein